MVFKCFVYVYCKFIHTNRLIILYVYIKGHKIRQNSLFYIVKEI